MLGRRDFVTLLSGAAIGWPMAARGQQPGRTYRVALVAGGFNAGADRGPVMGRGVPALLDELRRLGFSEGQNLTMDYRSTNKPVAQFAHRHHRLQLRFGPAGDGDVRSDRSCWPRTRSG
jgi:hypothetical protein